ncbi:MAG TPA: universal stress protein [Alphaproteobacteria bacterium]|nr:universal stress protein [Alphaproteobacteria bacterium]
MFKKILYPTAFEKFYQDVLGCVMNLKAIGTEEVVLLHVIYAENFPHACDGYFLKMANTLRHLIDSQMAEAVKIVESAGLRPTVRIEIGIPHQEILRVAEEENVSLIVCGRERKGYAGEILIGSITDRIVRHGKIPVYVPKCTDIYGTAAKSADAFCRDPFRRILYPTDWSDCAANALRYLKSLKNARVEEVIVAHVMDEKAMKLQPEEKFREFEKIDREKLELVKQELDAEGFKVKTLLQMGNPRAELIKIAKEENTSLILMGTHGKGRMKGILWGSVSRNTAEYSESPIMLIKDDVCYGE